MNLFTRNKIKKISVLFAACLLCILLGCDDIFVEDISDDTIVLEAPSPGLKTTNNHIGFRWTAVSEATDYRLEVVTPDFSSAYEMIFSISTDAFAFDTTLQTGQYAWRVKANNSEYSTGYFSSSFSIVPVFDISKEMVNLVTPEDQIYSNTGEVAFHWDTVSAASYYVFKIKETNWSGDTIAYTNLYSTNYNFRLSDGTYAWGVAAVDTTTNKRTDFSTRTLIIDQTPPDTPHLFFPENRDTIKNSLINMVWGKAEEDLSYLLEVYSDPGLVNRVLEKQLSDTTTYVTVEQEGTYFWRVNSVDPAGNISAFSPVSAFYIIFEPDISLTNIKLFFPAEGTVSSQKQITFWWDEITGANQYRIQVVTPSFKNPRQVIYNQISDSCSLSLELEDGDYEWRVRGQNEKYETQYSSASFSVFGADLTDKNVNLITPSYEALTNQSPIYFNWEGINSNAEYTVTIKKGSWEGTVVHQSTTTNTEAEINLNDGAYVWGVKAVNTLNNSSTEYSTRPLTVDRTLPRIPQLVSPENNTTTNSLLISFVWSITDNNETDLTYTLEMYQIINNSVILLNSKTTQQSSVNYNFEETGKYKWRVYATDKAGNQSEISEYRFFEID